MSPPAGQARRRGSPPKQLRSFDGSGWSKGLVPFDTIALTEADRGVPIQVGNETIGAVGSAGSTLEMDDACAKAGIAKVADLLK